MEVRINGIWILTKELFGNYEEFRIEIESTHIYDDGPVQGPRHVYEEEVTLPSINLPSLGSCEWLHLGTFQLGIEEDGHGFPTGILSFKQLPEIKFKTTVMEDDLIWDDLYAIHNNTVKIDRSQLQRNWNDNNYKPFEVYQGDLDYLVFDNGGYSYRIRLTIAPR